jgi:lipoate-protein ligase A
VSIGKRKDLWLPNARKIGGTASKISKGRSLQHGTILFDANLEWLKNSLSSNHINPDVRATKSVRSETANILSYLYNKTNQTLNPEGLIEAMVKIAAEYYEVDIERQVVVGDSFQSVFDRLNDENYISRK